MMERLENIKDKLYSLNKVGSSALIFGSNRHKFKLNPPLTEKEVESFERINNITLPKEYRKFLLLIGNGGAGPFYGLEPLQNGNKIDLDSSQCEERVSLDKPFRFNKKWNLDIADFVDDNGEVDYQLMDKEYYNSKWADGMLRIANFGCGVSINLIVKGEEYGNIWADDRCNEQGILPFQSEGKTRIQFLDWYESWLDKSITELNVTSKNEPREKSNQSSNSVKRSPFWKLLFDK